MYANLTITLGVLMESTFFHVWGSIYAIFTLCLWLFAMYMTIPRFWDGSAFEAPCLSGQDVTLQTERNEIRLEDIEEALP